MRVYTLNFKFRLRLPVPGGRRKPLPKCFLSLCFLFFVFAFCLWLIGYFLVPWIRVYKFYVCVFMYVKIIVSDCLIC
jgi:hypothetical protein